MGETESEEAGTSDPTAPTIPHSGALKIMTSYADQPRVDGKFAPLASDKQIVELQNLAKASFISVGHRINIRSGLKRYVTRADASKELTRLYRMRDAARARQAN